MPRTARTGNPLVAVAYIRASKGTGVQELSPEAQRAAIERWAALEGVDVIAWHTDQGDKGVSGGRELDDRPALLAALAELRVRRAGILIVAKRDRLARDVYVALTIERAAVAAGARIVSADGAGNGEGPTGALMRGIIDLFSEHERAMIRERTRAALAAKRARGERIGAVPYGFTAAAGKLIPDAAEQGVIAVVRELRAAGLSQRAIVAALAARGLVSRVGRPFQATQIVRMLAA